MGNINEAHLKIVEVVRISSIIGFIATVTLLMNLNFKIFERIFKQRTRSFWWLFMCMAIVPLLVFIYIFNILFGRL